MASSTKILVTPSVGPEFAVPKLRGDSAERASKVLQENHDKHHITFNDAGFHSMLLLLQSAVQPAIRLLRKSTLTAHDFVRLTRDAQ